MVGYAVGGALNLFFAKLPLAHLGNESGGFMPTGRDRARKVHKLAVKPHKVRRLRRPRWCISAEALNGHIEGYPQDIGVTQIALDTGEDYARRYGKDRRSSLRRTADLLQARHQLCNSVLTGAVLVPPLNDESLNNGPRSWLIDCGVRTLEQTCRVTAI